VRASTLVWASVILCCVGVGPAAAQQPAANQAAAQLRSEIDQLKNDFSARLTALEAKLAAITGETPTAPAAPPATAGQPGA
jgi:hypothetical protein